MQSEYQTASVCRKSMLHLCRLTKKYFMTYTKHHLKFGKNQADNLAYIGFRRRFFPVFYWCLLIIQLNLAILDEFIDNKSPFYDYLLNIDHFFVAMFNWGSNSINL